MTLDKGVYFVTGIDTDAGKSFATGILARRIAEQGVSVITQKFIQTGCRDFSEDIRVHRRIMGIGMQPRDLDRTTAPVVFDFPASPHLAARLEGRKVDTGLIGRATQKLAKQYDIVLIEGAGGLMVPIEGFYTTADYVAENDIPVIVVTTPRLGSINHTLLTLEVCRSRNIAVVALAFNHWAPGADPVIAADTLEYLRRYMDFFHPGVPVVEIPVIKI